jgi:hypothetical protein
MSPVRLSRCCSVTCQIDSFAKATRLQLPLHWPSTQPHLHLQWPADSPQSRWPGPPHVKTLEEQQRQPTITTTASETVAMALMCLACSSGFLPSPVPVDTTTTRPCACSFTHYNIPLTSNRRSHRCTQRTDLGQRNLLFITKTKHLTAQAVGNNPVHPACNQSQSSVQRNPTRSLRLD